MGITLNKVMVRLRPKGRLDRYMHMRNIHTDAYSQVRHAYTHMYVRTYVQQDAGKWQFLEGDIIVIHCFSLLYENNVNITYFYALLPYLLFGSVGLHNQRCRRNFITMNAFTCIIPGCSNADTKQST